MNGAPGLTDPPPAWQTGGAGYAARFGADLVCVRGHLDLESGGIWRDDAGYIGTPQKLAVF